MTMSHDDRIDLSPLDPTLNGARWEARIDAITMRAAPERVRRAQQLGVLSIVADWVWPTLAAATLAAVISGAVLVSSTTSTTEVPGGIAAALGLPDPIASWIDENRGPDGSDLIAVMERGLE
jgi:hypothetical protein